MVTPVSLQASGQVGWWSKPTGLSKEIARNWNRAFWRKTICFTRNLRLGFLQSKLDLGRIFLHG